MRTSVGRKNGRRQIFLGPGVVLIIIVRTGVAIIISFNANRGTAPVPCFAGRRRSDCRSGIAVLPAVVGARFSSTEGDGVQNKNVADREDVRRGGE